jgi:hypothetical protein
MKYVKRVICTLLCFITVLTLGNSISKAEDKYTDNVIPAMTSDDSPYGRASASSVYNEETKHPAYQAFDHSIKASEAWDTEKGTTTGWLQYEFVEAKAISKYAIVSRNPQGYSGEEPKDWTFEAWNESKGEWIVLDKQIGITDWKAGGRKEFVFSNYVKYKKYRINITANGGNIYYTTIGELEMMERKNSSTDFDGNRARLEITMVTGQIKEYDYSIDIIQSFVDWYDLRSDGSGKSYFVFKKDKYNPYISRKEYLAFDKISSFEIQDYNE